MSIPKKGGYSGSKPASEMGPPAQVGIETIKPFREHTTTKDCWCQPEVEAVPGPESPDSPYVAAMRRVGARRGLIADVDLVERQRRWLADAARREKAIEEQRDLALLRERAAKEDAATHAEREGVQEGIARKWESLRPSIVDLCALALFHAQHAGVSPEDRKRILDLVVRISEGLNR